jgi:DNA-binding IclR family transcriptional regulator
MSTSLVEKTFLILEAMAELGEPVPLRELSARTDLPKSTLHRILQTLTALGYADQDSRNGDYYLTRQIAQLGRGNRYLAVQEAALPIMQRLHQRFDETVNLGVLEGSNVYYLHALETSQPLRWIVSPGSKDHFHCTALGKAIVAFLPEEYRDKLIRASRLEARTEHTITSKRQLREELARIRERGVACDRQENDRGVACFAFPLLRDGYPIASISLSVPSVRLDGALTARILKELDQLRRSVTGQPSASVAGLR